MCSACCCACMCVCLHLHPNAYGFIDMPVWKMLWQFVLMFYIIVREGYCYKCHVITFSFPRPPIYFLCVSLCRLSCSVCIHRRCWNWVTMCPFFSCSLPQTTSALPQDRTTLTPPTQDSLTSLFRCLNSVYTTLVLLEILTHLPYSEVTKLYLFPHPVSASPSSAESQ